tara:strand:- start:7290 stop:7676 length:387 start_codon:yes stop_codon:yes gene_type:complete
VHSGWDQEVPCSLGSGFGENWGFYLDKPMGIQVITSCFGDSVTDSQVLIHPGAPEIKEPVTEPEILIGEFFVQLERKDLCLINDSESGGRHLNVTCRKLGIYGAVAVDFRPWFYPASYLHDIFRTERV